MNAKRLTFLAAMVAGLMPGICYHLIYSDSFSRRTVSAATMEESIPAPAPVFLQKTPEAWVEECRTAASLEAKTDCVAAVAGWKSMDFQKAADTALLLPEESRRAVLGLLLPLWAAAHGADCIPWLAARRPEEIGMEYQLTQLGESVLQTWIAADTAGFNQWMAENRKSYPPLEDWRIHGIIDDWMPRSDIAAAALASASSGVFSTNQDKPFLRALRTPADALKLTGAIDSLIAKDPRGIHPGGQAARFYRNLLDRLPAVDSQELRQWLATRTGLSSNENPVMLAECVNASRAPDPGKAAAILMNREDAMPMEMRLVTVINFWSRRDPAAAAAWLDAQGTGPETWQAREKAGAAWVAEKPEAAFRLLECITEPATADQAHAALLHRWHQQDAKAAENWLNAHDWSTARADLVRGLILATPG